MRTFSIGVILGVAITVVVATGLGAQRMTSPTLAYASGATVAAALREIPGNGFRPVVQLDPYSVLAEHRTVPQDLQAPAPVHKGEAELYYVMDGAATLVTGRTPDQSYGGATQRISKGDVLIIPEDTPHWLSAIEGSISYVSMHMPRSSSIK